MKKTRNELGKRATSPARMIMLSFFTIIVIGTLLFMLPIMTRDGNGLNFISALFTATSSVCVTGLSVIDPAMTLTSYGQVLLLILIEIGGVSTVTFASFFLFTFKKNSSLRSVRLAQEYTNADTVSQVKSLVKIIIATTVVCQCIGATLLSVRFIPDYGVKGIWIAIFTAVSAYCNAGFDLFGTNGPFSSLISYSDDPYVLFVVMALIIIGGIGFFVFQDILTHKKGRRFSLHTKTVITFTAILITVGFFCVLLSEYNNPLTLGSMSFVEKIYNALFQSVTTRTAGFASIDISLMNDLTKVLMMVLMFIGAGSGSTAGGIKITTFAVLVMAVVSVLRNRNDAELFGRKIDRKVVFKALAIVSLGISCVFITSCVLLIHRPLANGIDVFFEAVSAFATVGLSSGITATLDPLGLFALIAAMFIGRLGPICFIIAISARSSDKSGKILPEGRIMVG
ncbi:MAG: TrkH family potassium uptake protein [Clostridia bacterium]